jgi:NitT/TauT family transport system ATP-binding protein
MAMRAALARALVAEPHLLLLDEPFAALDTITRRRLAEDLHRLWQASRPTIVLVTHDVEDAVYLAGRALVLGRDGAVSAEVALPPVLPRPAGFRESIEARTAATSLSEALARTMEATP